MDLFTIRADGGYDNGLSEADDAVAIIRSAIEGLRDLLLAGDHPTTYRLRPPAYVDDDDHEREYRSYTDDELLRLRLDRLDEVDASVDLPIVTLDQLGCWSTVINELRLVIGTRLGVTEDDAGPDDDDPDLPLWSLYGFLSALLAEVIEVLSGQLPSR